MPRSASAPTLGGIRAVVTEIAEKFQPRSIILFGSYAYGQPTPDSDVDLLVVMEPQISALRSAADISQAIDHPFPLDIVVVSPSKWQVYLDEGAAFPKQVHEQGLVLYEADDTRVG